MFPIRRVDRRSAEAMEQLGTKPKFWFHEGERRFLFKAEVRGTGEDWAEVVACNLCRLIGLPHVEYELAEEYEDDERIAPGVVCENMAPPPMSLVLGNQLLLERDLGYPTLQRFKVRQHAVHAVCQVIAILEPPAASWMTSTPPIVKTALDVFAGYVLLDAWIANQDRHHENWAALRDDVMRLSPTFDHGAALGRNLTDKERSERLTTNDKNRSVLAFANKGRAAIYNEPGDARAMGLYDVFLAFARAAPSAAIAWQERLAAITETAVRQILDEVPSHRMSDVTKAFTLQLLIVNQRRLAKGAGQ